MIQCQSYLPVILKLSHAFINIQELERDENKSGREQVDFKEIEFKRDLKSTDHIEANMTIVKDTDKWEFVAPRRNPKGEVGTKVSNVNFLLFKCVLLSLE